MSPHRVDPARSEALAATGPLLRVEDLAVRYATEAGPVQAVAGVSFEVRAGEVTALVGESGSGKTSVAQAVIGLLAANGRVSGGSATLGGTDLLALTEREWRGVRGRRIALVPQDPGSSLNPVQTIGASVSEALRIHGWRDRRRIRARVLELLERVDIDDPATRADQYPHELSGGMRQRVLIAAALALEPRLVIADEPTSALDVTVQRRVLDLLDRLREESGTGVLFITHDLAVAADRASSVVVMRDGSVREAGPAAEVLGEPADDYTRRLLADAPSLAQVVRRHPPEPVPGQAPLVQVSGLRQEFRRRGSAPLVAVDDVSFTVARGTTHAIVGESGSGKTTIGRSLVGLNRPTAGRIRVGGTEVTGRRIPREFRRTAQLVYQSPFGSLDPRQSVAGIVAEPLLNFGLGDAAERAEQVARQLELVSLPPETARRRPHELSGGQRQRVAIARALVIEPDLVVLDEAVSALDVTVQAQILRLLARLQDQLSLTYVFISHDLAVVRQVADTVSVLQRGQQVESATTEALFEGPEHPYTQQLLSAIPGVGLRAGRPGTPRLGGTAPSDPEPEPTEPEPTGPEPTGPEPTEPDPARHEPDPDPDQRRRMSPETDVIDRLAGIEPGSPLAAVRAGREQARTHAERSFAVLLEPTRPSGFGPAERWAVAAFTAGLHGFDPASRLYLDGLASRAPELVEPVAAAVAAGVADGPYGSYREPGLRAESAPGPVWQPGPEQAAALGPRLSAALAHAHLLVLRPRESSPAALGDLAAAGWDADAIVSLSQLVSFLAFQIRAAAGLRAMAPRAGASGDRPPGDGTADRPASPDAPGAAAGAPPAPDGPDPRPGSRTSPLTGSRPAEAPERFTQQPLGWVPWLEPVPEAELDEHQREALIEPRRASMPYFRLLARDPDALLARTLTDLDIFANPVGGVGRAERELAAAVTSRRNGCVFCASVHAAFATRESGRREDVQRLLDEGVDADLGDARWQAVAAAAVAVAATPTRFGPEDVQRLRAAGFDDAEIVDLVYSAAFFNWANRLMLSLGEPEVPARRGGR